MTENKPGKIIIIVAPSGAGKSTLIKRIRKEFPTLKESISYTTRPMRRGEEDGVNYFFTTKEDFKEKIAADDFLEWAEVHSNFYGTSKQFVEDNISKGISVLFDVDVQGTDAMKDFYNDKAKAIFIAPPSLEVLEQRLRDRATDKEEVILERISNAQREILRKNDYDFCVVNDDLDQAFEDLKAVFTKILED